MRKIFFIALVFVLLGLPVNAQKKIVANPINLNYRFYPEDEFPSRREAADPVCEYFKGKYYLFASKSGGYWSSPDLAEWTYIKANTVGTIENYAPTILIMDDAVYFMASWNPVKIYKNSNPDTDNWQLIDTKFQYVAPGTQDPAFFKDDDGKAYIYWGCSDKEPIYGVEVDPKDGFKVIGEAKVLITHNFKKYGWEEKGPFNNLGKDGYNEGPCMIKYKGKYYLQYAAPGTEVRVYGDGIYVSDHPLGPYTYEESNPFSFKPGGFIGGAGHGHTFLDKYGNYWHVATMAISVRHSFERRLGLFPMYVGKDDVFRTHTVLTDYPYYIPDKKLNIEKNDLSMGWHLLSYGKKATASSSLPKYETEKANDEQVESWWSAQTGNAGEWWQVDLGKMMEVQAVQVNLADQDFTIRAVDGGSYFYYQYEVESSTDGTTWTRIVDRRYNYKDAPHDFVVLDKPLKTRYIRIKNSRDISQYGKFSLYDFRVFGHGLSKAPKTVPELKITRKEDRRRIQFNWNKVDGATGYIIHWGVKEDQLKNTSMVMDSAKMEAGYFNRDSEYFFSIDSFNENGITKGKNVYSVK